MEHLESEFYKDVTKYEKPQRFGLTKRRLIMQVGIILAVVICSALYYFNMPPLLIYLAAFLIVFPLVLYGRSQNEAFKERLNYRFTIQHRTWQTEIAPERRYNKHDFIQAKTISEAD